MKRISVQIPNDLQQLLKRRAIQNGISVSQLVNGLITRGLEPIPSEADPTPKQIHRYLLKSVFETLLIVRTLVNPIDETLLKEASQKARELATQAWEKIDDHQTT